ncbi:MAG TPA: hypothetical protein VH518_19800 [Tepidisphaeraceae bacterium]|jgi:hypothetical protein
MDSSKISIKLFLENANGMKLDSLVPVFHAWIQNHSIENHLLIDVANYAHVKNGPGIVLVAHEGNFSVDQRGGRLGLTYQRKQQIEHPFEERVRTVFETVVGAAALLEGAPPTGARLKFRTDEIELRICDRLFAPNNTETLDDVKPDVLSVWPRAALEHHPSDLELFEVTIKPPKPFIIAR